MIICRVVVLVAFIQFSQVVEGKEDLENCSTDILERNSHPSVELRNNGPLPPLAKNSTSILASNEDGSKFWFQCSHKNPIQWIYNNDIIAQPFTLKDYYIARTVKNFDSAETYEFLSDILIQLRNFRKPVHFSCQSVNNPCERTIVFTTLTEDRNIQFDAQPGAPLPISDARKFGNNTEKASKKEKQDKNTCDLKLIIKETNPGFLEAKCETSNGVDIDANVFVTNNAISLNSILRSIHQERPECTTILQPNEECKNCREITKRTIDQFLPLVLHCRSNNIDYIQKGFFSVPQESVSSARFHLNWYDVNPQEMMHLQEPPKIMYEGDILEVICNVSTVYFAKGIIISTEGPNSTRSLRKVQDRDDKYITGSGVRMAKTWLQIPWNVTELTVFCFAPVWNSTSWVNQSRTISVEEIDLDFVPSHCVLVKFGNLYRSNHPWNVSDVPQAPNIQGNEDEFDEVEIITWKNGTKGNEIQCKATGNPKPTLTWVLPRQDLQLQKRTVNESLQLIFSRAVEPIFEGYYNCVAKNFHGTFIKVYRLRILVPAPIPNNKLTIKLAIVFGILLLVLTISMVAIVWWMRKVRKQLREETLIIVRSFYEGHTDTENNKDGDVRYSLSPCKNSAYNTSYEIPSPKWNNKGTLLGSGAFGVVTKGTVQLGNLLVVVAIKSLKDKNDLSQFKGFLEELKIMAAIGTHPNIVNLVGACTDNIENREMFIGVEFCENGNLLSFLTKQKAVFQNLVDNGKMSTASLKGNDRLSLHSFTTIDLIRWSVQIAEGMNFLASKTVLHGDLAARNILLSENKTAKISDFGLSKDLSQYADQNYSKKTRCPLPWKWMAIESLRDLKFSVETDVWAYGILLWEIFTFGQPPYPGQTYSTDFMDLICNGMRLHKPICATDEIYEIMLNCWKLEPTQRVKFMDAASQLSKILDIFDNSRISPINSQPRTPTSRTPSENCDLYIDNLDC